MVMPDAVKQATKLDNIIPVTVDGVTQSRYKHLLGSNPDWPRGLRTFGEARVVKTKAYKMHPKEADRGVTCMFIGYPDNHPWDCYQMWDPKTGGVHMTKDIIWLQRMYFPKAPAGSIEVALGSLMMPEPIRIIENDESEAGEGDGIIATVLRTEDVEQENKQEGRSNNVEPEEKADDAVDAIASTTRSGRIIQPLKKLIQTMDASKMSYEIGLTAAKEHYHDDMASINKDFEESEICCVGAGIGGGFSNTTCYELVCEDAPHPTLHSVTCMV